MRENDKINVLRLKAAFCQTFHDIGASRHRLSCFDVFLDGCCITLDVFPQSQVKDHAGKFASITVAML